MASRAPSKKRRTIRFNISVMLLMLALTGVAMAAVSTALVSEIDAAPRSDMPSWVHTVIPLYPWALLWVVLLAGVTVWEAFRLRSRLSLPLERLVHATAQVSEGELDTEIPMTERGDEIEDLSNSIRVMRDRLVDSIDAIDARNTQMNTILANLEDGVIHVDAPGVILEANARARQLLRELTGEDARSGVALRSLLTELPERWLVKDQDTQRELTMGDHGRTRFLLVKSTPVRSSSKKETDEDSHLVVLRDVTESKEVEQLKNEFLSVVTHELKTPLTAIEGYAKLMLMGKSGELSEKQSTFVKTIHTQTTKLKHMIQDLLDVTRLEAGRLPLSMVELSVEEALSEAQEAHQGDAETRGISLTLDASGLQGATFIADPFRLQQVLGNLLSNAMKFTEAEGKVTLLGGHDDQHAWLNVSDTGRGIPEEAIPNLFDKFFQVQRGDTRLSGGAGLGLYISRQLVEAQGGTIGCTSTVGVGSIFTVRFPRSDVAQPSTGDMIPADARVTIDAKPKPSTETDDTGGRDDAETDR